MSDVFYVMVDHPKYPLQKKRWCRPFTTRPKFAHQSLDSAKTEAQRLANLTRGSALVLRVESVISPYREAGEP